MVIPSEKMLNLTRRDNGVLPVSRTAVGWCVRQLHLGEAKKKASDGGVSSLCFRPREYCAVNITNGASDHGSPLFLGDVHDRFFPLEKFSSAKKRSERESQIVSRRPDELR